MGTKGRYFNRYPKKVDRKIRELEYVLRSRRTAIQKGNTLKNLLTEGCPFFSLIIEEGTMELDFRKFNEFIESYAKPRWEIKMRSGH